MSADPTPEERAAKSFNRVFEGRGPEYVARLADLIREADAAARAKALEEAVAAIERVCRDFCIYENDRALIVESVRAIAKEAPRAQ